MLSFHLFRSPQVLASLLMGISGGFVIGGYEFLRSATNSLFKQAYGINSFPYILSLMPIGVILVILLYSRSLSLFGARRTLTYSLGFSACFVLICYFLIGMGSKIACAVLFVFREAYIVLIIEQLWSYINSVLSEEEAKKINGLSLTFTSVGSVLAGLIIYALAESLGTPSMLLFCALSFLPAWLFTFKAYELFPNIHINEAKAKTKIDENSELKNAKLKFNIKNVLKDLGINLFMEHKVLWSILGIISASQFYGTFVMLNFQNLLDIAYPEIDKQTAYSGLYFSMMHSLGFFCQLVLSPLLLYFFTIPVILLSIPLLHLGIASWTILAPSLLSGGAALLIYKAVDYSLFRATKEILYIPLPYDARFRSKEVIDVLGYRFSKGASSMLVSAFQKLFFILGPIHYAYCSFGCAILWIFASLPFLKQKAPQKKESPCPKFS